MAGRTNYDDESSAKDIGNLLRFSRGLLPNLVLVLIVWLAAPMITNGIFDSMENRGQAGDLFGSVNSLFAGLAFAGVIYSVRLQREDLRIVREDSRRTKAVLEKQEANNEAQRRQIDRQNFEATFFRLLETYASAVRNLKFSTDPTSPALEGHDAIAGLIRKIDTTFMEGPGRDSATPKPSLRHFRDCYGLVYRSNYGKSGAYFRTLHTILRLLDKAEMSNERDYAKILRAQMTDVEATFLALNFLSNHTTIRFNPLIEKYHMLKNADIGSSRSLEYLLEFLPAAAFGSRSVHDIWNITATPLPPPENDDYRQP